MNKNWGSPDYFLSGGQNLPLPPHVLRIIQYKALLSVLLKNQALQVLWSFKNIFETLHDLNDSHEKTKMLKAPS